MASLSAKEAAEQVGMTKAGLLKAVRKGTISGQKDEQGEWRIDPAELFRVYAPVNRETGNGHGKVDDRKHPDNSGLQAEIELLREMVRRADDRAERAEANADKWAAALERSQALLTDARVQDARRSIWSKLWGR